MPRTEQINLDSGLRRNEAVTDRTLLLKTSTAPPLLGVNLFVASSVISSDIGIMVDQDNDQIRRLAEQASQGSRAAFSELVNKLMNRVVAVTYRMTGEREAALDLTQDAFVSAWEGIRNFRQDSKFETWLYRIAVNKALNYIAHRKISETVELTEDHAGTVSETADDLMGQSELKKRVVTFMQSLPDQQRIAFELRFYKQMTFDEIAEIAGRGVPTVKTNYREAIQKLRKVALEEGWRS